MAMIGFVQFDPKFGESDGNRETIRRLAQAHPSADLLVFPELAISGYEFASRSELEELGEPFETGPTCALCRELAAHLQTTLVVGYAEKTSQDYYNSCFLVTPNGSFTNYRKIHLFSREKEWFRPGDAAPPVVDTPLGRVGLMICFDWVFPETARLLALQGAQIIAQPANLVLEFCQKTMIGRSIENRVFTITANRTGVEERMDRRLAFTGLSQVTDTKGTLLVQGPKEGENVGLTEVSLADADDKMITAENHLFNDRRTDLYGGLLG